MQNTRRPGGRRAIHPRTKSTRFSALTDKGYGVCGDYHLANVEHGHFYYNSATEHLALGTDAPLYHDNCDRVSD